MPNKAARINMEKVSSPTHFVIIRGCFLFIVVEKMKTALEMKLGERQSQKKEETSKEILFSLKDIYENTNYCTV